MRHWHVAPDVWYLHFHQDGPSDGGDESDKGEDDNEKEDSPEKEELENFSDVASSNEEEDNFPNTCISQFVKVQDLDHLSL